MKLKLCFLSLFICQSAFSQNSIVEIDAIVSDIRQNQIQFQKEEKKVTGEGSQFIYYELSEPRLVEVVVNGKIEKNVAWFYFQKNLIYTETNWSDSTSGKSLYLEKTYHNSKGMIAWIDSDGTFIDAQSSKFKSMDKELKSYGTNQFNTLLKK